MHDASTHACVPALQVVAAVVVSRRRTLGRIRATEQAMDHLMGLVRRKSNKVTRLQDESGHADRSNVLHWIDWRSRRRRPEEAPRGPPTPQ
jgi:hypothetical protein